MWRTLSNGLYRVSNGWLALLGLLIFAFFIAVILPAEAERAAATSGGAGSPDSSFFYSAEDLYGFADAYGPEGRAEYIRARFSFDVIWPLAYGFFFVMAISWTFGYAFDAGSRWRWGNLVPVLGVLFDFLENVSASLVMWRYPLRTPVVAELTPVFSLIKWTFVNGSFVVVLFGVAAAGWRWWRRRRAG